MDPRLRPVAGAFVGATGLIALQVAAARRRPYLTAPPAGVVERAFGGAGPSLHLVVIGDSTAVGVGAGSLERSYPVVLARLLAARFSVTLDVLGRSGARIADVAGAYGDAAAALRPDVALVAVGGNDAIHLTPLRDVERNAGLAIDKLAASGATVVVALGPRFDAAAVARPLRDLAAARCRGINRALRRAAAARGVTVVDAAAAIGDAFARDPRRYFCEDLYHPGPQGYGLWARALHDAVATAAAARVPEAGTRP